MIVYVELARKHECEIVLLNGDYKIAINNELTNESCVSLVGAWIFACEYLGYSKDYLELQRNLGYFIEQAAHYGSTGVVATGNYVMPPFAAIDYAVNMHYGNLPLTNDDAETEKLLKAFKIKIGKKPRGTWATFHKSNCKEQVYCAVISDGSGNAIEFKTSESNYEGIHALLLKEEFEAMFTKYNQRLLIEIGLAINQYKVTQDTEAMKSDGENHIIQCVPSQNLTFNSNADGGIRHN